VNNEDGHGAETTVPSRGEDDVKKKRPYPENGDAGEDEEGR
jgi:hypothetical protein